MNGWKGLMRISEFSEERGNIIQAQFNSKALEPKKIGEGFRVNF
jgi:hypothetical protein